MASYATAEDILIHGFQLGDRDIPRAEALCEMFSRLFDTAVGVAKNYFAPAAEGATASARIFWGDGTDLLKLDPYTGLTTVAMPTGWTVPDYVELSGQALRSNDFDFGLIRTYGDNDSRLGLLDAGNGDNGWAFALDLNGNTQRGWPDGIKVTVTAIWGYDETPADVKLAVIESVIAGMRGMDQAYMRVTNLETNTTTNSTAFTPRAQLVVERYRAMRGMFA